MTEATDTMFEEAVEALRQENPARARELLTRLIKANQKNVTYWLWMSAAVETTRERVYCLETILKLDPRNEAAQRGLTILGARPPDRRVKPFQMNRSRAWEDKLLLENEAPHQTVLGSFASNPLTRLVATVLTGLVLIAAVLVIGINSRAAVFQPGGLLPVLGSATPTATEIDISQVQVASKQAPTPLAVLLGVSYTPTPVYVNTPRAPVSAAAYRMAQEAEARRDWDRYAEQMLKVQEMEPKAADVQYLVGEKFRTEGACSRALYYYNEALKIDNAFAPGYLGLARARQCAEPRVNVLLLYDLALESDPAYGEVYLDRAAYYMDHSNIADAESDLAQAGRLMPNSALVPLERARLYFMQGQDARALSAAQKANSIDKTLLPAYFLLGRGYVAAAKYADAIPPLRIFLVYEAENADALTLLGRALTETGDYRAAVDALNEAIRLDRNQTAAYAYLGTSYLRLDNLAGAEINLRRAIEYYPDSFDAQIGLTEIYYRKGTYGNAYLQAETAMSKANGNTQKALAIYWRALTQEGRLSWADALKDWRSLLNMPPSAMTPEMRSKAEDHIRIIVAQAATPKPVTPSATATPTPTSRPGSTATPPPRTPTPGS
ncbi:MAG TPA: tetratricopeptide repeat protein [Anaerolineales bacterium]